MGVNVLHVHSCVTNAHVLLSRQACLLTVLKAQQCISWGSELQHSGGLPRLLLLLV